MSIIKTKTKEVQKDELIKDKVNLNENKSVRQAKELIKKLLQNTLNQSLLKLESNCIEQMSSLKLTLKNFNEFSKLLSTFSMNTDDVKKKKLKEKEKERKTHAFKRGRKLVTESNINNRSKTIENNLMKFKNKLINIDGKKNISKLNKKPIITGHKSGNRTMSSFRNINEIEKEQDNNYNQKLHRFKNISFQNTSQNFRKGTNKIMPVTPVIKLKEKEKNQILAKALRSKRMDYRNGRNNHSRTIILSHLTDIDEKNENIEKNNNNENQKAKVNSKNVKRIIYKNENKNKVLKINYQTEKINEKNKIYNRNINENLNKKSVMKTADDINDNINNDIICQTSRNSNKNINIQETNELKKIVKLVDDVNENLNKLLKVKPSQNNRRTSIKEIKFKNQSTNALITAIKDVRIKEIQNNSLDFSDTKKNNPKNINSENISKCYSLNYKQMRDNIIKIKEKENILIQLFRHFNRKDKKVKQEIFKIKKNRSFTEFVNHYNIFESGNCKIFSKSYKNVFEKINQTNPTKNSSLIEKMKISSISSYLNDNHKNQKLQFIKIIIKEILDKTNDKIETINKQKSLEKENYLINEKDINKKAKENNIIIEQKELNIKKCKNIEETIKKQNSGNYSLKSKLIVSPNDKKLRKSKSLDKMKKVNKII